MSRGQLDAAATRDLLQVEAVRGRKRAASAAARKENGAAAPLRKGNGAAAAVVVEQQGATAAVGTGSFQSPSSFSDSNLAGARTSTGCFPPATGGHVFPNGNFWNWW
jgi:hypothetical protein